MRVLVTIPHYHEANGPSSDGRWHGSTGLPADRRRQALARAIAAWHHVFGASQCYLDLERRAVEPANSPLWAHVDLVICTTRDRHLVDGLALPTGSFEHVATSAEPIQLGYACHAILRERLGAYDYYGYLEDDLVIHDPWFFRKLAWFTARVGDDALLLPNRYEVTAGGLLRKAYVDGHLPARVTAPFQDRSDRPVLSSDLLGVRVVFHRPRNPHAGCFFLNAAQMAAWSARADFLDGSDAFIGPLESAATLGVMRAFRIYKPVPENAAFLEIQHVGSQFIDRLPRPAAPSAPEPATLGDPSESPRKTEEK